MAIKERIKLYREIEALRQRPLIVYVTSSRVGANGIMAGDVVPEILAQLQALPAGTKEIDLLIASHGGDPTVAWRIVSLLRERVERFSVLVPQAAFSAATLVALGADTIVMHPHANLGPVDAQIMVALPPANGAAGPSEAVVFGAADLEALLQFARERVGLGEQDHLAKVIEMVCNEVGALHIGKAARGAQLSLTMGENLLLTHMKAPEEQATAKGIAQALNQNYFHHGYPVSRTEARKLGLKVEEPAADLERLMWEIWLDVEQELQLRAPFSAISILRANPACQALFDPAPQVDLPPGLPTALAQQVLLQALSQVTIASVPPAAYATVAGMCESPRWATRHVTRGSICAARMPDLQFRVSLVQEEQGWVDVDLNDFREHNSGSPNPEEPHEPES